MKIKVHTKKSEDAASVFDTRKKETQDRLAYIKSLVDRYQPSKADRKDISALDYILDSLDNVIKDTKKATGLSD